MIVRGGTPAETCTALVINGWRCWITWCKIYRSEVPLSPNPEVNAIPKLLLCDHTCLSFPYYLIRRATHPSQQLTSLYQTLINFPNMYPNSMSILIIPTALGYLSQFLHGSVFIKNLLGITTIMFKNKTTPYSETKIYGRYFRNAKAALRKYTY